MSEASDRGRDFEMRVAKLIRRKGIKAYRDKRSGAGDLYKADIAAPGFNFNVECKSQDRISLEAWFSQAVSASSRYKQPLLVIEGGMQDYAVLKLNDFLDLVKIISDDTETIKELREKLEIYNVGAF